MYTVNGEQLDLVYLFYYPCFFFTRQQIIMYFFWLGTPQNHRNRTPVVNVAGPRGEICFTMAGRGTGQVADPDLHLKLIEQLDNQVHLCYST